MSCWLVHRGSPLQENGVSLSQTRRSQSRTDDREGYLKTRVAHKTFWIHGIDSSSSNELRKQIMKQQHVGNACFIMVARATCYPGV